jgi:hypothetical protein
MEEESTLSNHIMVQAMVKRIVLSVPVKGSADCLAFSMLSFESIQTASSCGGTGLWLLIKGGPRTAGFSGLAFNLKLLFGPLRVGCLFHCHQNAFICITKSVP